MVRPTGVGRGGTEAGPDRGEDRGGPGAIRERSIVPARELRLHDSARTRKGPIGIRCDEERKTAVRGRQKLSRAEIVEIRAMLVRIRKGGRNIQMRLRRRLRKEFGFYVTGFDASCRGFTRNDLELLVSSGLIEDNDEC